MVVTAQRLHYGLATLGTLIVMAKYGVWNDFNWQFASWVGAQWVMAVSGDRLNTPDPNKS